MAMQRECECESIQSGQIIGLIDNSVTLALSIFILSRTDVYLHLHDFVR